MNNSPSSIKELASCAESTSLILRGLDSLYFDALAANKVDAWATAAHSAIALIALARPHITSRGNIEGEK